MKNLFKAILVGFVSLSLTACIGSKDDGSDLDRRLTSNPNYDFSPVFNKEYREWVVGRWCKVKGRAGKCTENMMQCFKDLDHSDSCEDNVIEMYRKLYIRRDMFADFIRAQSLGIEPTHEQGSVVYEMESDLSLDIAESNEPQSIADLSNQLGGSKEMDVPDADDFDGPGGEQDVPYVEERMKMQADPYGTAKELITKIPDHFAMAVRETCQYDYNYKAGSKDKAECVEAIMACVYNPGSDVDCDEFIEEVVDQSRYFSYDDSQVAKWINAGRPLDF